MSCVCPFDVNFRLIVKCGISNIDIKSSLFIQPCQFAISLPGQLSPSILEKPFKCKLICFSDLDQWLWSVLATSRICLSLSMISQWGEYVSSESCPCCSKVSTRLPF